MGLDARLCERVRLARDARFDGRFFIAVLSTGIYCRPICPSPTARSENVRYFATAAEAVAAGFRPCLRCRPEAAPGTPRWNGTSSTVSRALRLIEDGALQDQTLAELSRRLGVSPRHLHRLFRTHLGASPLAVAKARRLAFAERLIRETDWPMSRVALASGFRTVRRFNDAIRTLYGRTPSELRRRRGAAPRTRRDECVFRLAYRPPYAWEPLLERLGENTIPGIEEISSGIYRRTFSHGGAGAHGIVEVSHDARVRALEVRMRFASPVSPLPVLAKVRALFDLEADPAILARRFRRDPLLGPLLRRTPGLRVPGPWNPFEEAVRVTLSASRDALTDLVRRSGEALSLRDEGGLAFVFPTPGALVNAELDAMPWARVEAVRALSLDHDPAGLLDGAPHQRDGESAMAASLRRAGLSGPPARYIAMRAFGDPDAFAQEDAVLQRESGARTAADLLRLAEKWRPWRAYAAAHLWRAATLRATGEHQRAARRAS